MLLSSGFVSNTSNTKDFLTSFPNAETRVENETCSIVFVTNLKVFGNVANTVLSVWYIFSIKIKTKQKTDIK